MRYVDFDDAFSDIYPRVMRTLMVASGEKELSAKIAQESMGEVFAHWKKFQKLDAPVQWVREISVKKLSKELKQRAKDNKDTVDLSPVMDLTTFESLERAIRKPYAIDFVRAVGNLKSKERIVPTLLL